MKLKTKILTLLAAALMISAVGVNVFAQTKDEWLQEGHRLNRMGDVEAAIEHYQKALEIAPDFEPAQRSLKGAQREQAQSDYVMQTAPHCRPPVAGPEIISQCFSDYFLFSGRPVHPLIIRELVGYLSDSEDVVVAIDLEGSQNANQFCCTDSYEVETGENGKLMVTIDLVNDFSAEQITEDDCGNACIFRYQFEGSTSNGVQVVRTWERTGGSGVFSTLLLLRMVERQRLSYELNEDTAPQTRTAIDIEKLGLLGLGDREQHDIAIDGNNLLIDARTITLETRP